MINIIKKTLISALLITYITTSSSLIQAKQSVALSYGIADLKFTGNTIQICELGPCANSTFFGLDKGAVWRSIWKHASSFGLPMWFIAAKVRKEKRKEFALDYFEQQGGTIVKNLTELETQVTKKSYRAPSDPYDITQYQGIVFMVNHLWKDTSQALRAFKDNNPYLIFSDATTKKITNNKALTNQVFYKTCNEIKAPWLIKNKEYTPTLAQEIITEFDHPIYVIKPIASCLGKGVIIVRQEYLDGILRLILTEKNKLKESNDDSFAFWAKDREKEFLLEAFVPSKPIEAHGNYYDATMRVIYAVTYHHDEVSVEPFANYWRLPKNHLEEQGSLNNMHKSYINHENLPLGFAVASAKDEADIYQIIQEKLPLFFAEIMRNN